MIRDLLRRLVILGRKEAEARDGEYRHVFCPHCGAFIPQKYRVFLDHSSADSGMTFDCPDCSRSGAVLSVTDREPALEWEDSLVSRLHEGDDDE